VIAVVIVMFTAQIHLGVERRMLLRIAGGTSW